MTGLPPEQAQAEQRRQRIRVGMIGLAAVVLLIGLASAILSSVNRERPVTAAGASREAVVANMASPSPTATNEPLAELGVAPSAPSTPAPSPTPDRP